MSDHDAAPDPVDKAYARAEALLEDHDARAARRARVLAAVHEAAPPPPIAPPARRAIWRRGGWLAAASIAGLGVLLATHVYEPVQRPAAVTPPPTAATPAPPEAAVSPPPPPHAETVQETPAPKPRTRIRVPAPRPAPPDIQPAPPPPAPAAPTRSALRAFPARPSETIVLGLRAPAPTVGRFARPMASGVAADAQRPARILVMPIQPSAAPPPIVAPAPPPPAPNPDAEAPAGLQPDPAVKLRAAAAAGRIAEMEALLNQGVPIDAPDPDGNTALMSSVQADRPAAAALLVRHGANPDQQNRSGVSAKDLARTKGDRELSQALGLVP